MNIIRQCYNKKVVLTTFLSTFIIHGMMLFDKLSWHDEVAYSFRGWNEGLPHGRWMHMIMANLVKRISGMESLPIVIGAICALCIAIITCLVFDLFDLNEKWMQLPLILIFCSIPAVAGHFGYMSSAGYDFIGKALCMVASYLLCKGANSKRKLLIFLLASFVFSCSLGEYQCYLTFYLAILLSYFTMEILENENTWKGFWKKAFYYVGSALCGLILYLLILKLFLYACGETLTSYAGTDKFGIVNVSEYVNRIILAYKEFFNPELYTVYSMFPFHWKGWYIGLLVGLLGLMVILIIFRALKKQYKALGQYLITFALLPLGMNFNFVLYGSTATHSIHMYHYTMLFVYLFVLGRCIVKQLPVFGGEYWGDTLKKGVYGLITIVVLLFGLLYIRYDNFCYVQTKVRHEAAISYYTTLITRIQSVQGYNSDYPIVYINEDQKENIIDNIEIRYDPIVTNPYSYPIINNYAWRKFVANWCGFNPEVKDSLDYKDNQLVKKMPCYPDDGSIKIIDNIIVVKF